ncbi:response regulator [Bacteroidaceae bacterium]|jgi:putative two-component system response regulator
MALSKYTILVADYIPTDMMLLKIQLNRLHSRLLFATDGFDVLRQVEKKRPDLILMDLYMPGISGFEVADVLAQQEYTRKIPIIYIVNMGDYPIYTPDGRLLSQKEYIEKPFDMRQLVKRILQWLAP